MKSYVTLLASFIVCDGDICQFLATTYDSPIDIHKVLHRCPRNTVINRKMIQLFLRNEQFSSMQNIFKETKHLFKRNCAYRGIAGYMF